MRVLTLAAVILFLVVVPVSAAKITWTTAAAVTTISINLLDIKDSVKKTVKAWRATKKTTVKVIKKIGGK